MKSNLFFAFIAAGLLVWSSCQQPAGSPADLTKIKAEIQALENEWAAALGAKDVDALMAMYTDDAISMGEGQPMRVGKDAIRKAQEQEFAGSSENISYVFEVMEVLGTENNITEIGTSTHKDASGNVVGTGKYMVVWEKHDGKYLCSREIYNSDTPPAPSKVRSVHLYDLPKDLSEAEWQAVVNEMNSAFAEQGFAGVRYNVYKSGNEEDKNYRYFLEGVWPSDAVYQAVRENEVIKAAYEKSQSKYDKIKTQEIYRRVNLVN